MGEGEWGRGEGGGVITWVWCAWLRGATHPDDVHPISSAGAGVGPVSQSPPFPSPRPDIGCGYATEPPPPPSPPRKGLAIFCVCVDCQRGPISAPQPRPSRPWSLAHPLVIGPYAQP